MHFLVECNRLSNLRHGFIQAMKNILMTSNTKARIDEVFTNPEKANLMVIYSLIQK